VDAALTSRPLKPLRVKLHYQRFRQDDDTRYIAFNPSTGQYGYIPEDGGHQTAFNRLNGRFDPGDPLLSRGDWRFASIPFEWKRDRWDVDLSLRLPARSRAELSYRGERIDREHRERERTREDRVRAALHSRGLPRTSLRISYEVSQRNGSRFDAEALRSFRTSSLPGYTPFFGSVAPLGLASLERPDLTDRDRQALELRAILALAAAMDLSITGRLRSDDYDAAQGLERERVGQISVEWSWQPSPRRGFYAFGSWEARDRDQGNVRGTSALLPNPYPESAAWDVAADLNNLTLGTGLRLQLTESVELQSDYVFQLSSERFDYSFASAAALPTGLTAGQAGSRLPDLQRREHTLETRLRWRARERWTVELYHRLDRSRVDDFQQKGLFVVDGNRLFVGHVDRDYKASVYGVSLIRSF
jgi:hypothetical protein